jgi:maltose alpha-D-glucosyltransferase/alpha-amylase
MLDAHIGRWYKDAVIYEVHVRAFHDGNGDGVGDFRAHREARLPPGPRRHRAVAPALLSLARCATTATTSPTTAGPPVVRNAARLPDCSCAKRTSAACGSSPSSCSRTPPTSIPGSSGPGGPSPGSRSPGLLHLERHAGPLQRGAVIFKDFEASNWSYDPVAQAYFWHRFYSHQPSLNYDNPSVRQEMLDVVDFWLSMGVDGLRLDAVPYLYAREGTTCENLPETFAFLRRAPRPRRQRFEDRMLLAEANQWPEDAVRLHGQTATCATWPSTSRSCRACSWRPARRTASRSSTSWPRRPRPLPRCQWALFLRNHDELTLEMVTDEERDYMYRVYAQDPQARVNVGIRRRWPRCSATTASSSR